MNNPTIKQLEAFARLLESDDFKVFMGWVDDSISSEAMVAVNMKGEPERSWIQGRVQQLDYMRAFVRGARGSLAAAAGAASAGKMNGGF